MHRTFICFALVLTALAGCSRQSEPAPAARAAPTVRPAAPDSPLIEGLAFDEGRIRALMTAIFAEAYDPAKNRAHAAIQNNDHYGYALLTFVSAQALPGERIAVVVNGTPSDEEGNDLTSHAASGVLNLYVLRRNGGAWEVLERHEGQGELGSMGYIGDVKWAELGPGRPGFVVMSGGMWQGQSISHAEIHALDDGVRHLGGFPLQSSNGGACMPETGECWDVEGTIRVAKAAPAGRYPDLSVAYRDKRYTVSEPKKAGEDFIEHVTRDARTTVLYRFDGKAYAPVAGTNPVPSI